MTDMSYGERELVLGSVIGERFWEVDVEGILRPITYGSYMQWTPGINEATCLGHAPEARLVELGLIEKRDADERPDYTKIREAQDIWKKNHDMAECEHGFYGLWKGEAMNFYGAESKPLIRGVIEGSGEVLIGTKGFRATRARILALSVQQWKGMWSLDEHIISKLKANYPGVAFFDSILGMGLEFQAHKREDHDEPAVEEVAD